MRKIVFLALIFISCKQETTHTAISYKDSVVKEYLQYQQSVNELDTNDLTYKVLNAYTKNDTAYFRELHRQIEGEKESQKQWAMLDSCIRQPELKDLNADVAYRFTYKASFCLYRINITVTKKANSINLHLIIYQYAWNNLKCQIESEYDKPLTVKNWEDFTEAMEHSDFWGLKKDNGHHGFDGSTLIVSGFEQRDIRMHQPPRFHYVSRWGLSTLAEPFDFLLKLSAPKKGCIIFKSKSN